MNNKVSFIDAVEDSVPLRLNKMLQMKKSAVLKKPLKAPVVVVAGGGK